MNKPKNDLNEANSSFRKLMATYILFGIVLGIIIGHIVESRFETTLLYTGAKIALGVFVICVFGFALMMLISDSK